MIGKFSKLLASGCFFIVILGIIYFFHVQYFTVNVVFYAAIADGLLATVITAGILYWVPFFSTFNAFEKFLISFICMVAGYAFAISVPTVLDRSLSFYILEKIDQRGGGIKKDRFDDVFTKEYMVEHRLVDVRLTEQLESGTIVDHAGCIALTAKGERLVRFSRWFRQNLLPKHRLLMGEYTDDLTDPFRHSQSNDKFDYQCSVKK